MSGDLSVNVDPNAAETVVVLSGGLSHERDVSLRSGRRVALHQRTTAICSRLPPL